LNFLDGEAIVTMPEQLDSENNVIPGARHAALDASCWNLYGALGGIAKCIIGTPARVRVVAFMCASVNQVATTPIDAIDPAVALRDIAFAESPQYLDPHERRATWQLHEAVYIFSRGSGDHAFHIENGIDAARVLAPFNRK